MLGLDREADNLFISPHYDDIAFSLGGMLLGRPGGTMVLLFTRTAYTAGVEPEDAFTPEDVDRISAMRNAEDARFAEATGLTRVLMEAKEPSLQGGSPFDGKLERDVGQIEVPLRATLDRHAAFGRPLHVWSPAAIGRHINHLAARTVVLDWFRTAPAEVALTFYEDLPYASTHARRTAGIADLRSATAGLSLRRRAWRVKAKGKLALLNLYASQHPSPPVSLSKFSPAWLWPLGPHEAGWDVSRT